MSTERAVVGNVEILSVTDGMMPAHPSFLFSGVPPEMYQAALGDELTAEGAISIADRTIVALYIKVTGGLPCTP
jgi:hypothetical protein